MSATLPSLDLLYQPLVRHRNGALACGPVTIPLSNYGLHDRDGYLEFLTGIWLHTAHLAGKPTAREVVAATPLWSVERRHRLVEWLRKHGQLSA